MTTRRSPLSEIISVGDLGWQERQPGIGTKSLWMDPETERRALVSITRTEVPGL
jgi:hypothetical protein